MSYKQIDYNNNSFIKIFEKISNIIEQTGIVINEKYKQDIKRLERIRKIKNNVSKNS